MWCHLLTIAMECPPDGSWSGILTDSHLYIATPCKWPKYRQPGWIKEGHERAPLSNAPLRVNPPLGACRWPVPRRLWYIHIISSTWSMPLEIYGAWGHSKGNANPRNHMLWRSPPSKRIPRCPTFSNQQLSPLRQQYYPTSASSGRK